MSTSKWGTGGGTWESEAARWKDIQANGYQGEEFPVVMVEATKTTLPDFTIRVRAGMDLLDKINPGWQDTLNLDALDLEDDTMCVLGQSWSHYATTRGLAEKVESSEFRHYVEALAPTTDDMDEMELYDTRIEFAASIGCALNYADFALINAQAFEKVEGNRYAAKDLSKVLVQQSWEHLTRTWVTEINKAKEEGRWAPANASDGEATAVSPSESPVTVS